MADSTASNPPRISVKIANIVFASGIAFFILVSAYAAYRIFFPIFSDYLVGSEGATDVRPFYIITGASGLFCVLLFGLGLRLKDHIKVNLSLFIITTSMTVYAFETYLEFSQHQTDQSAQDLTETKLQVATGRLSKLSSSVFSDKRTKQEVLLDLKEDGVDAYPNIYPQIFLRSPSTLNGLATKNGKVFPLGGISGKTMVLDNENGYWLTYVADKYGFHNPQGAYDVGTVDIVLTGDSFTEGSSVRSNENIGAVLRKFGFNVINLGKGGNGPILEYAALKEYGESLKPKIVLWLYFENDLWRYYENEFGDLSGELASPLLMRYLNEDEFSQNLILRQDEIDGALDSAVNNYLEEQKINSAREVEERKEQLQKELELADRKELASKPLIKILKLRNLRIMINLVPEHVSENEPKPLYNVPPPPDYSVRMNATFKQTLEKADHLVSSWSGKLYFIYLPSYKTVLRNDENPWHKFALRTATEVNLQTIDLYETVFVPHSDPLSLFPFRHTGHYNEKGYQLVAEAITERLRADGVLQ